MKNLAFRTLLLAAVLLVVPSLAAQAQSTSAVVVAACGTPPTTYSAGANRQVTQDTSGKLCTGATVTLSGTQDVNLVQTGGVMQLRGAGAVGTGSERVAVGQDATTVAGSAPGTAGTPSANVLSVQGVSGGTTLPTSTSPGARTIVALDISAVTTGGTAVAALSAGHRTAGGFLQNPIGATIALCINEQGTASGTTSAGATTCIQPGQSYNLTPAAGAVSVITSDSSHPFSGYGLN
jgi:hypothetical protein